MKLRLKLASYKVRMIFDGQGHVEGGLEERKNVAAGRGEKGGGRSYQEGIEEDLFGEEG